MLPEAGICDRIIALIDEGLRAVAATPRATRSSPADGLDEPELTRAERQRSGALMRVNHAGEIAAQALYYGQALTADAEPTRRQLLAAASEERDHLAWCARRLVELRSRPSLLAPAWFAGSAMIGAVAGAAGSAISLGFVVETERQVEAHLRDHLSRLPQPDTKSRAILEQMAVDEAHHGTTARLAGGQELPLALKSLMRLGGGVLRSVALRV